MPNDENQNDLRARWQNQPPEGGKISLEEIRAQAQRFQKRIRNRNVREYIASIIVILIFTSYIFLLKPVVLRVASGMIIVGTLWAMFQLHKRASTRTPPGGAASTACLEFHRRKLERQRDALLGIWTWYLLPFMPGIVLFIAGIAMAPGARGWVATLIVIAVFAATITFVLKLNYRAARRVQRMIDELRD